MPAVQLLLVSKEEIAWSAPLVSACETQGTLFFDICQISLQEATCFVLENVRNLKTHIRVRRTSDHAVTA